MLYNTFLQNSYVPEGLLETVMTGKYTVACLSIETRSLDCWNYYFNLHRSYLHVIITLSRLL
jgi:hypothetical protein